MAEQQARTARRDLDAAPMRESKVIETVEKIEEDTIESLEGRLSARERAVEDIQRRIDEAISVVSAADDEISFVRRQGERSDGGDRRKACAHR